MLPTIYGASRLTSQHPIFVEAEVQWPHQLLWNMLITTCGHGHGIHEGLGLPKLTGFRGAITQAYGDSIGFIGWKIYSQLQAVLQCVLC